MFIRLLSKIFNWNFEPCKGCEVLKQQLDIANLEKRDLMETMLGLVKPEIVSVTPTHVEVTPKFSSFSRHRKALEERDREEAKILTRSVIMAKPDSETQKSIEALEEELKIAERENAS